MATLKQITSTESYNIGWYGSCDTPCASLDLTIPFIRQKLYKVYQVGSSNADFAGFDASIPSEFDNQMQEFTSLECGKSYIIVLTPGDGSIDIPQFNSTTFSSVDAGRVVSDCQINITPTPEPTSTPTPTASPSPTPTSSPQPEPTPTPTPTPTASSIPPVASNCSGFPYTIITTSSSIVDNQISFSGFPPGWKICHWGAEGGPPNGSIMRIPGVTAPIGKMVTNGMISNKSIKYISPTGDVYRATFKNSGVFTDLILI